METYFALISIDIAALLFLCVLLHTNNILAHHRKKPFVCGIVVTVFVIAAEAGTVLSLGGGAELRSLNIVCNVLGFALTPLIPLLLLAIFDAGVLRKNALLLLPSLCNIILAVLSPRFGLIFTIDASNQYHRGALFIGFVVVYLINLLYLAIITIATSQKFFNPIKGKTIFLSLFVVAGTSIQLLVPSAYTTWHGVTISLFLYYILLWEYDGSFDMLTGLYNRTAFQKIIKHLPVRRSFSVVMIDINDFKGVNDTYGHEYGDTVLRAVADIIKDSFDQEGGAYHIGGDEFYAICLDTDQEKTESQIRRMIKSLTQERQANNRLPTVSFGYSICDQDQMPDIQKMLRQADEEMYKYKNRYKKGNEVVAPPADCGGITIM